MSKTDETTSIRIATLNLCNYIQPPLACYEYDSIYSQAQWQQKQQWLATLLRRYQPDVIGFQEVFSCDALQKQLRQLGYPHFHVVEQAELIADYIYHKPVVAVASRFPISSVAAIQPEEQQLQCLGWTAFQFSRHPLRATIRLPTIGPVDFYVVHLKSQRPILSDNLPASTSVHQLELQTRTGRWAATVQRGTEAHMLMHAVAKRRLQHKHPALILGDFNEEISVSHALSIFVSSGAMQPMLTEAHPQHNPVRLVDSFELYNAKQDQPVPRSPTHYYGSSGSVLDYILVSDEFDSHHPGCLADISHYQCIDEHLIRPDYTTDSYSSDHAAVLMTLQLRRYSP